MALKLRDDQIADLVFAIQNPKGMFLHDPGTGKTPPTVVNQYRRATDLGIRTVWSQPKHLLKKNKAEILRFTPFKDSDVAIVDGTPAQVSRAMTSGAQVFLMGPDRFKRVWNDLPPDVRAHDVDELHMCYAGAGAKFDIRNASYVPSDRVQALYAANDNMAEGIFMTGSIINGRLDNAFPAIHCIEPNYYPFGYDQFIGAHAYCDDSNRPVSWHSHERIGQILGRHGIRRTFEQVYGRQTVVFETEWLDMNARQRKLYDQFEADAYLELEQFLIDGTTPGVATIRARQIMEHPNHFRDLRDPYNLPHVDICPGERPAKLEAMAAHFEHHNINQTPVIVFAALVPQQEQIAQLAASMGRRVGLINGDTSSRVRNEIDIGFQEGRLDTIVGSAPCCAVGYNWQFCGQKEVGHVIMSSLTYMHTDFSQGYKRAIRGVRSSPLRVTTQAYFDSADLKVMHINVVKSKDAHLVDPTQDIITFSSHEEIAA